MNSFDYTITVTKEKFPQLFAMKKKNRNKMINNMLELGYSCYFKDPGDFEENQVPEHLIGLAQNKIELLRRRKLFNTIAFRMQYNKFNGGSKEIDAVDVFMNKLLS